MHTAACLTVYAGEYNPGVIIGDDVSVAVLWFVDLQVGVLPCELLTRVNGLEDTQIQIRAGHRDQKTWKCFSVTYC